MHPGSPQQRKRGSMRVATRKRGPRGARGLIGLTHHQVTRHRPAKLPSKRPMGWGWGLTGLAGGGGGALRESGQASRTCDWPRLAMVAGAGSL